ncbi:MAG: type II secretion system protein [Nitrospirae bacterium]|nr:type II secretion system protein [Nitrospirota bacterium]
MRGSAKIERPGVRPAGKTATISTQCQAGLTLIEILVVFSIIALLVAVLGGTLFEGVTSETRISAAAREVMADLHFAQRDAASQGGSVIIRDDDVPAPPSESVGRIRRRWEYVVFDTTNNLYSIWRYQDTDGDNIKEPDEVSPAPGFPPTKTLLHNVGFGLTYKTSDGATATVGKSACGNGAGIPSSPVSFGTMAAPPCYGKKCMKMTSDGVPSFTGTLYLSNNTEAYAVNINAAGLVRLCKWSEDYLKWVDAR